MDAYDVDYMIRDAVLRVASDVDQSLSRLRIAVQAEIDDLRDELRRVERELQDRTEAPE